MSTQQNEKDHGVAEKQSLSDKVNDFLRKYRIVVIAIFVLSALAVVGIGVWSSIDNAAIQASATEIERLDKAFGDWSGAEEAKKADLEKSLLEELDKADKQFAGRYAGMKAILLRAQLLVAKKDWSGAEKAYLSLPEKFPKSDFAPAGLRNAAVAAEERGDDATAIAHLSKLIKEYPDAVGVSHDYFALGRLNESVKDYAKAKENYETLVSKFPDDDWTKLAKDRIIFLSSTGM